MSLDQIKKIREITGAGMVDVKKAIDEAKGDEEKAIEILKKKGQDKAAKKTDREAKEGVVASYIHSNQKIGSIVKLFCETDFVARNEEFQELANDIAMHVSAMNPKVLNPDDSSEEGEALLSQPFVKDPSITIQELINEKIGKTGENIQIGEFARFEL